MCAKRILARFTTRHDGASESPYTSCNLGLHVGDEAARVLRNRERQAEPFGLPLDAWVAGEQVHGDVVAVVTAEQRGAGARDMASALAGTDALITNVPGIVLSTYAADCVPLLFADERQMVIGAAHAGWQGTVLQIGAKTVAQMQKVYGCEPTEIRVRIGPSIGPCCYEVDERVAVRVREAFPQVAEQLLRPNDNGRWQLDLWAANEWALQRAGVPAANIVREAACTSCQVRDYFSHRKEQGKTGRHAGLIAILAE